MGCFSFIFQFIESDQSDRGECHLSLILLFGSIIDLFQCTITVLLPREKQCYACGVWSSVQCEDLREMLFSCSSSKSYVYLWDACELVCAGALG
jgi:hypothetical protein